MCGWSYIYNCTNKTKQKLHAGFKAVQHTETQYREHVATNINSMTENILDPEINMAKTEDCTCTTSSDDKEILDLSNFDGSADNILYKVTYNYIYQIPIRNEEEDHDKIYLKMAAEIEQLKSKTF